MMNEIMDMHGHLTLQLMDRLGHVIQEQQHRNHIVTGGRQLVARLFGGIPGGTPSSQVTHMAVGMNPVAPADDQTGLGTERSPRKPIVEVTYPESDEVLPGGTVRRVHALLKAVFDFNEANGPEPLREAGIFTAATGGVMYNRVVFDAVTKTDAFNLTLLWDITF